MTGDVLEVVCGPMVAGGDSLVRRPNEKVMFVEGGIPGEKVRVEVTAEKKDLVNARVIEVLEASDVRVTPSVQLPAEAGGCEWQHIDIEAQREYKMGIVTDALTRIAKQPNAKVSFAGAVDPTGYRTSMRVGVLEGKAATYKRHTKDLVPLTECAVAHPLLREMLLEGDFGDATEVTLRVSASTGQRSAWVKGDIETVNLPEGVDITSDGRHSTISETVGERKWQVSAASFFQSGPQAAELIAATVDGFIDENAGWIVDAYAGVGILGGIVAEERDAQLTSVEQSKSSVRDARSNLADLAAEIIEAEVATVELAGETSPDTVIADPSRTGLGPSASKTLAGLGPKRIVLVSCDPASLARDVNLLADLGYSLREVKLIDVFPHTAHVETVSLFKPA